MIGLGVDGMDPIFVETHLAALPNLNRLRQQGTFRRLATTVPPQSPVAWSTFITGMDPGGHGISISSIATRPAHAGLLDGRDHGTHTLPGHRALPASFSGGGVRSLRAGRTFWQMLDEHGVRSSVTRMPANFPPAECGSRIARRHGTPDMTGSFGTFRSTPPIRRRSATRCRAGRSCASPCAMGAQNSPIPGPPNQMRRDRQATRSTLTVDVDPSEQTARFDTQGTQFILREG